MTIPIRCEIVYKRLKRHILGSIPAAMNKMSDDELVRAQLKHLQLSHAELDGELAALGPNADMLSIRRLKKRKLVLKDQIAVLEDQLYPDIIA